MKLEFDRIWVTVFAGDPELKLDEDEVAIGAWEKIGMPPERIVRLPRADNFWSVGGPGPCGPDSEMFFDWGEDVGCGRAECAPGCECERFLEFWNLVFMEFELHQDGSLTPLPEQNIDTGMGLERAARILQKVTSVYDTDGYQAIMALDRGAVGRRLRRERRGDEGASDPRRPRARNGLPRGGRGRAVERRAWLRDAPGHPPGGSPGAAGSASRRRFSQGWPTSSSSRRVTRIQSFGRRASRSRAF